MVGGHHLTIDTEKINNKNQDKNERNVWQWCDDLHVPGFLTGPLLLRIALVSTVECNDTPSLILFWVQRILIFNISSRLSPAN